MLVWARACPTSTFVALYNSTEPASFVCGYVWIMFRLQFQQETGSQQIGRLVNEKTELMGKVIKFMVNLARLLFGENFELTLFSDEQSFRLKMCNRHCCFRMFREFGYWTENWRTVYLFSPNMFDYLETNLVKKKWFEKLIVLQFQLCLKILNFCFGEISAELYKN